MVSDLAKYFDHNATTPVSARAIEVWTEASRENWHNPSSLYPAAGYAKQRLDDARENLADLLGFDAPERIVFVSGATEANNVALRFLAESRTGKIVVSAIEHPSVAAAVERDFGAGRTIVLDVCGSSGSVDPGELVRIIGEEEIAAVSVMAANNETGAIQPWREIAAICRKAGVPYHCDAAQWIGKMSISGLGECDYLVGCGHKFGAGKGVGFLVLPEAGAEHFHAAVGGPQEEGRRAGTEDLSSVLAMVAALEERMESLADATALSAARDAFERRMVDEVGAVPVGAGGERLPNTSMIVLPHGKNLKWLVRLGAMGFAVSTGSACSAGKGNPSSVMQAMGLNYEEMGRVLRFSSSMQASTREWNALADAIAVVDRDLEASER